MRQPQAPQDERRSAWLAERRLHITGTDVPRLFGFGGSPMDVWLDKMNLADERVQTERMEWGLRLQRAILEGYADRYGIAIRLADPYALMVAPGDDSLLAASLDGITEGVGLDGTGHGIPVDAKNIAIRRPDEWGPEGSDIIPHGYMLQLTVQMIVTGASEAHLAVLFGGNTLVRYRVRRDPEIVDRIREEAARFWASHVLTKLAPPLDASEGWRRYLARIPQETPALVPADPFAERDAARLVTLRGERERIETEEAEIEARLKASIGTAAGLKLAVGKVTWKQGSPRISVDWESVARRLADEHQIPAATVDEVAKACTTTSPGSRRFVVTIPRDEESE